MFDFSDPKIVSVITSFITAVLTVIITIALRSWYEKRFHIFKLESEHRYTQRKKIKEILSTNKIQLLNCCESLNHRLWNFSTNYKHNWHLMKGDYSNVERNYYFSSFIHRLLSFYAWVQIIENKMVYIDTTISSKEDLSFIKYLRLFPQIFCDVILFKGMEYDESTATDHFFRNAFTEMAECMIDDDHVISYSEFTNKISEYSNTLHQIYLFLDGISPNEDRPRWDRLQAFHIILIAFINSFGYDFQYTSQEKMKNIFAKPRKNRFINNLIVIIERINLDRQKGIKKTIKNIK